MGHWASFCLRFILSVKISIKGRENIINDDKKIIGAIKLDSKQQGSQYLSVKGYLDGILFLTKLKNNK